MKTWHKVALAIVVPTVVLVPAIIIYRVVKKRKQEESLGLGGSTPKTTIGSNTQGKPNTGINVGGVNVKLNSLDTKGLIGKFPIADNKYGETVGMFDIENLTNWTLAYLLEWKGYVKNGNKFKSKVIDVFSVPKQDGSGETIVAKLDNGKYSDYSLLKA